MAQAGQRYGLLVKNKEEVVNTKLTASSASPVLSHSPLSLVSRQVEFLTVRYYRVRSDEASRP